MKQTYLSFWLEGIPGSYTEGGLNFPPAPVLVFTYKRAFKAYIHAEKCLEAVNQGYVYSSSQGGLAYTSFVSLLKYPYIYRDMKEWNFYGGIAAHASEQELTFIENAASAVRLFVSAHRGISRTPVSMDALLGIPAHWGMDRLVRVYALTRMEEEEIDRLWDTAEINEAVALYSALYYLKTPEKWIFRATEAVRSNIGDVFDALAFENPYPAAYFSESQWNQLVLKCIFNDKGIHRIQGLEERRNAVLARSISDFAHERWAAGRHVPAQVWRLVEGYIDADMEKNLEHLSLSARWEDRYAHELLRNSDNKQQRTWAALEIE